MTQQSELVHVTTQQVNGETYNIYAMPGGKLLAVPLAAPLPVVPPTPVYPTYQQPNTDPPFVRMDSLTRNILLGLASVLVFGLVAMMFKPVPVPVAQATPPPRYPTYERTCRPSGFMGWSESCSERRGYEY